MVNQGRGARKHTQLIIIYYLRGLFTNKGHVINSLPPHAKDSVLS